MVWTVLALIAIVDGGLCHDLWKPLKKNLMGIISYGLDD